MEKFPSKLILHGKTWNNFSDFSMFSLYKTETWNLLKLLFEQVGLVPLDFFEMLDEQIDLPFQ